MNAHNKHSAQAGVSLYSMRGKSWSYYQKHVANLIGESTANTCCSLQFQANLLKIQCFIFDLSGVSKYDRYRSWQQHCTATASNRYDTNRINDIFCIQINAEFKLNILIATPVPFFRFQIADVQRLDLTDCNLYGVSPSNPGPMVLCDLCNHVMAPEGIMRHVIRVHGSKIVPTPTNKLRIPSKGISTAGPTLSNLNIPNVNRLTNNSLSTPQATESALSTEFSNRLNVSKMAPPTQINSTAGMNGVIKSNYIDTLSIVTYSIEHMLFALCADTSELQNCVNVFIVTAI